ncbi:hypothetical protein [Amycolatopsis aidingensis]|uniref:hypothetical protein n=1 Tax=Amycolatopsis aidingensis TaxID=2842453 RepID=UPI001C0CAF34|nr:hypothetical protein [Amycolatopsis aidingensis]
MPELESSRGERLVLRPLTWKNLKERAADLRRQFGLLGSFVPTESQPTQVFNFWRGLAEARRILVFQTTKIALETFRDLSIYHDPLPVILPEARALRYAASTTYAASTPGRADADMATAARWWLRVAQAYSPRPSSPRCSPT